SVLCAVIDRAYRRNSYSPQQVLEILNVHADADEFATELPRGGRIFCGVSKKQYVARSTPDRRPIALQPVAFDDRSSLNNLKHRQPVSATKNLQKNRMRRAG